MLEIVAFVVTFGGMLLYGFGHAFSYANRNRVIRRTVEDVVDAKLHGRTSVKHVQTQAQPSVTPVSKNNSQLVEASVDIDFESTKIRVINSDWNFAKKPQFEPGEDHTELYKEMKDKFASSNDFESTVLTGDINDQLDKLFNDVSQTDKVTSQSHEVGQNVAALITNTISDLEVNKTSIIVGKLQNGMLDGVLELSYEQEIVCGEDDLLILKGLLLPNNSFRVINLEDADTAESGYSDAFPIINEQAV
ncbi:hypothetical protein [Solibacillus sp. FSL W7-1324]|uniref:hypothetical protein n=1 Tax=Solibacillus sp. FSL W7-1324 TaxID=2921701 RepID=UPI0030FCBBA9